MLGAVYATQNLQIWGLQLLILADSIEVVNRADRPRIADRKFYLSAILKPKERSQTTMHSECSEPRGDVPSVVGDARLLASARQDFCPLVFYLSAISRS